MKRIIFALLALLTLVFVIERSTRNRFVIENNSGKGIRTIKVEISGRTFNFKNIPSGGGTRAYFRISGNEGSFLVRGELDDGSQIDDLDCGYVVWEDFGKTFTIAIAPDGSATCKSN